MIVRSRPSARGARERVSTAVDTPARTRRTSTATQDFRSAGACRTRAVRRSRMMRFVIYVTHKRRVTRVLFRASRHAHCAVPGGRAGSDAVDCESATRFVFLFGVRNARPWRRSGGCRRGPRRRYNVNGPRAYRGPVRPRPEAAGRSPSSNQPAARSVSYSSRTRSIPALTLHRTAFADAASPAFAGSAPLPGQAQYWSRSTRSRRTPQFLL